MTKLNEVQNHFSTGTCITCMIGPVWFLFTVMEMSQNVREGSQIKFTVGLYAEV